MMKKLMSKKANIFGKKVPVFVIALIAVMGLTSAALLTYFGVITGLVTVNQGLTVDGQPWDHVFSPYTVSITSLEEKTVSSGLHYLKNAADVASVVKLNSVCSATTGDGCSDVTTTPVFELSITGELGLPGQGSSTDQDRVTAKSNGIINVNEITSLAFDYMLTTTTNGLSPYFVLAVDMDNDGVYDDGDVNVVSFQENGMTKDVWYTHNGVTQSWHVGGSMTSRTFDQIKTTYSDKKVLQVKVMIGYWGDSHPTTALVKNIKMNSADVVKDNGLVIRQVDNTDPNDKTWGDTIVDFSIDSHFPKMMKPATYTITTTVAP